MQHLCTIQKRNKLNDVYRVGDPGPGGAYHDSDIYPDDCSLIETEIPMACIEFQRGPRSNPESRHGVLDSDLLEIVRDRLKAFCAGPMTNAETERALGHVEAALHHLNKRVEDRIRRNVLGTMEK